MYWDFERRQGDLLRPSSPGSRTLSKIWTKSSASCFQSSRVHEYGIGYTPFYYCTTMVRDLIKVDMLSIDGVSPSNQTLRDGTYPFMSNIYAAIRKTESQDSKAYKLFQFLFTKTGANMIDESGYIAIRK